MAKRRSRTVNPFDSRKSISKGGSKSAGGSKKVLQQLQSLQQEMLEAQEEIAEQTFTATVGGGIVSAVVTGDRKLVELTIEPEVVDPEDVQMLQDLVVAAVNKAMEQIDQASADRMADFTGGLGPVEDLF